MKLTSSQLRRIIKEEIKNKMMDEGEYDLTMSNSPGAKKKSMKPIVWPLVSVVVDAEVVKEFKNKTVNDVAEKIKIDGLEGEVLSNLGKNQGEYEYAFVRFDEGVLDPDDVETGAELKNSGVFDAKIIGSDSRASRTNAIRWIHSTMAYSMKLSRRIR